ncbi:hypothetical protein [Mycolicibacter minnesotensis]
MSAHKCDPEPSPAGGLITKARVLRVQIEMLKAGAGERADVRSVVLAQTGGCPDCSATLFFGTHAMLTGTLIGNGGPDVLMALELQLAGVEADIKDADGD